MANLKEQMRYFIDKVLPAASKSPKVKARWNEITKGSFGMAEPKKEGEKLWPNDYLVMNLHYPPPTFYTAEEKRQFKDLGYPPEAYGGD